MSAASPLTDPPVASIAEAVQRMEAIHGYLRADDGLRYFNLMYLEVTKAFQQRVRTGFFQDQAFMERLDVIFANLYFAATRLQVLDPPATPHAWTAVFDRRDDHRVLPLQFAVAGMNAHINFDLGRGLPPSRLQQGQRDPGADRAGHTGGAGEAVAAERPSARAPAERARQLEHHSCAGGGLGPVRAAVVATRQRGLDVQLHRDPRSHRGVRRPRPPRPAHLI